MTYEVIKNKPVAQFFYRGNHSHPVKRVVFLTETDKELVNGYEVQCGNETFDIDDAVIKSYRKDKIATVGDLRSDNTLRKKMKKNDSTFERMSVTQAEQIGVI